MGNKTSCSIDSIIFSDPRVRKDVEKRIIQAVVKEQHNHYVDYDFTVYDVLCVMVNNGLEWHGSIRYAGQIGSFRIEKIKLIQRLCKCH